MTSGANGKQAHAYRAVEIRSWLQIYSHNWRKQLTNQKQIYIHIFYKKDDYELIQCPADHPVTFPIRYNIVLPVPSEGAAK